MPIYLLARTAIAPNVPGLACDVPGRIRLLVKYWYKLRAYDGAVRRHRLGPDEIRDQPLTSKL
jgi:hypothetical protein